MLLIKNLMVFYENAIALNEFNFEIKKGQIVSVIGSNSAGKTTLLNTISGLMLDIKIKEKRKGGGRITILGNIIFEGEDITNIRTDLRVKRGIVLCRERHPIFPESDVLENLKIAGYLRKRSEMKEMIEQVFNIFPTLTHLEKRRAGFLSGGEQQMLCVGMALITRPRLLLMDEPLLGLSPMMQQVLVKAIRNIRDRSIDAGILISEQFARPILPYIDCGYVIENGMVILSGTGPELMENPEVKASYFGI